MQHPPVTRRRPAHSRTKSNESEKDEEHLLNGGEAADTASPPPPPLSPTSEQSPPTVPWTLAQERQAQEDYENELAEHYLYELVRQFASAARKLAFYDCKACLRELEQLPLCHQRSTSVLIMVGKVHYEMQDYSSVSGYTCFNALFPGDVLTPFLLSFRQREPFALLARLSRIVCGTWKSIRRSYGTCNGTLSFRISLRSCSISTRSHHKRGLPLGTYFRCRRTGHRP